jgi:Holliday junction resolvasome RuvABC endonuclease subunit
MIIYFSSSIPIMELAPSHWRSIIKDKHGIKFGRSRAEQKQKAQDFVKEFFNKEVTEDEADAICLGLAGVLEDEKNRSAF